MNPSVARAVIDADRVAATFRRALEKLDDAAVYEPDGAREDDWSLMRVRRLESPMLWQPTDLSTRYTTALKAVHETLAALLVLDLLDRPGQWLPRRPSWRRSLLPVGEARLLTDALMWALGGVRSAALPPGDEGWVLLAIEPLSALRGRFWVELAWRECRYGCGRAVEGGRSTCRRHRSDRVA